MSDGKDQTTPKLPRLEADVTISDGRIIRVTGLFAVEFRKNPEGVRQIVEEDVRRRDWEKQNAE